jgi:hypothetical protein
MVPRQSPTQLGTSVHNIANFAYFTSIFFVDIDSIESEGERVHLTAPKRKSQSCEINKYFLAERAHGSSADARLEVFQGIFTNNEDIFARLDSLLDC